MESEAMSFCYLTQQGQAVILFHEKTIVHHIKGPLINLDCAGFQVGCC